MSKGIYDIIITRTGKKVDWHHPPAGNERVRWMKPTMYGRHPEGSFRTVAHMQSLNTMSLRKFKRELVVIQPPYNTTVPASAGTHDFSECWDIYIPGVSWWRQQAFFRARGFGCWYRHPPLFGNHIHGFTLPIREGHSISDDFKVEGVKVGKYVDGGFSLYGYQLTSSQVQDYYNHAFGLANAHVKNSDRSWFPKSISATVFNLKAYNHMRRGGK